MYYTAEEREENAYRNTIFALTLYEIASLFTGTFFGYMGYRLFLAGVIEKAGELEHTFGKEHLILKEAAPGTFFALFGCVIVVMTLVRGLKTPKLKVSRQQQNDSYVFDQGSGGAAPPTVGA